jgi:hypothetical protein
LKNQETLLELWRENLLQRKILRLMHSLRGHCEKNMGLVAHSQAISTPQIQEKRPAELLTNYGNANCS